MSVAVANPPDRLTKIALFTGVPPGAINYAFQAHDGVAAFDTCAPLVELHTDRTNDTDAFDECGFLRIPSQFGGLYVIGLPLGWWFIAKQDEARILLGHRGAQRGHVLYPEETGTTNWAIRLTTRYTVDCKQRPDGSEYLDITDNQNGKSVWSSTAVHLTSPEVAKEMAERRMDQTHPDWRKIWAYWEWPDPEDGIPGAYWETLGGVIK
ncbi:hypothetical protein LCGC14_0163060 [marine sediment metagenome]|uniref:Uncharacterized protein n=1 Tax=marine sediment metagenome TaxID=412755 RepID=A0A0F9VA63_9ZZZZ